MIIRKFYGMIIYVYEYRNGIHVLFNCRFNHWLGGLNPVGYHLGNIILHAVVTGLFTHVARLLLRRNIATLVAGLLFASHPIHTEAVAGVVGRADILACLFFPFGILVLHEILQIQRQTWRYSVITKPASIKSCILFKNILQVPIPSHTSALCN